MTPGSKEPSTAAATSGEKQLDRYSHGDPRSSSGFDPVFERNEIRYNSRDERSDAGRLEAVGGKSTKNEIIARYLKDRPRCMLSFRWSSQKENTLNVVVDSERAGCPKATCSSSGGVLKSAECSLRRWTLTQATTSLSSAEAEEKGNHERMCGAYLRK